MAQKPNIYYWHKVKHILKFWYCNRFSHIRNLIFAQNKGVFDPCILYIYLKNMQIKHLLSLFCPQTDSIRWTGTGN